MNLTGRTILITGAARRLGKAIALDCAKHGADVILHFNTSAHEVKQTAEEIRALEHNCWVIQADLSSSESVLQLFETASGYSNIYGLINNASLFKPISFVDTSLNDWERHFQVNLTAPFLLTQAFAKYYHSEEAGRVINLVDWRALRPGRDHFPYTISKAGLVALTQATALSLAPRITVNAVALGAILPPENEPENPDLIKKVPMKRWANMDEFLQTIIFLLEGPVYITGEVIHLDGGRHLV
ncbi:MAG TPA: SDR family oxidoreductase [Anaerolineaceae bacterium]|nr:SDR family oxidoreductase [Anaerolineaceae bacterium]